MDSGAGRFDDLSPSQRAFSGNSCPRRAGELACHVPTPRLPRLVARKRIGRSMATSISGRGRGFSIRYSERAGIASKAASSRALVANHIRLATVVTATHVRMGCKCCLPFEICRSPSRPNSAVAMPLDQRPQLALRGPSKIAIGWPLSSESGPKTFGAKTEIMTLAV
jgi:hypothetical protein